MWAKKLNYELKLHDSFLYLQETKLGRFDVYRKSSLGMEHPYFIFSLTDSWVPNGIPTEWGIEVVLSRIKALDLWKDETVVDRIHKDTEKKKESEARSQKNNIESFLYDFRRQFQKSVDGINTSTLDKIDYRKIGEKNGYC